MRSSALQSKVNDSQETSTDDKNVNGTGGEEIDYSDGKLANDAIVIEEFTRETSDHKVSDLPEVYMRTLSHYQSPDASSDVGFSGRPASGSREYDGYADSGGKGNFKWDTTHRAESHRSAIEFDDTAALEIESPGHRKYVLRNASRDRHDADGFFSQSGQSVTISTQQREQRFKPGNPHHRAYWSNEELELDRNRSVHEVIQQSMIPVSTVITSQHPHSAHHRPFTNNEDKVVARDAPILQPARRKSHFDDEEEEIYAEGLLQERLNLDEEFGKSEAGHKDMSPKLMHALGLDSQQKTSH